MDEVSRVLGWTPNKELRMRIMKTAKEEGVPVLAVASRYSLPEQYIMTEGGDMIDTPDGRMSIKEYQDRNPYKKLVIIR